jgi:FkbM family methyltransferase
MKLSYAQRLEDYHLASAFCGQQTGFYVDVGAGHPVADNVSYWFYLQGWRGLVIEPQEELMALYRHVRPRDIAVCSLVGRTVGMAEFHLVDRLHGLSTMVEHSARRVEELGARYITVQCPVATLARLFEIHGVDHIDFLKVDVEGAEGEVFAGADWKRWRPRVIVAEVNSPGADVDAWTEWDAVLLDQDYRIALFDGLNRFYVAQEEAGLLARLPRVPAPWDVVRHLYEFGRAPENPEHPDHALSRNLISAFLACLPTFSDNELLSLLKACSSLDQALPVWSDHLGPARPHGGSGRSEEALRDLIQSDAFRAALGRISAPFDGGLLLDSEHDPI